MLASLFSFIIYFIYRLRHLLSLLSYLCTFVMADGGIVSLVYIPPEDSSSTQNTNSGAICFKIFGDMDSSMLSFDPNSSYLLASRSADHLLSKIYTRGGYLLSVRSFGTKPSLSTFLSNFIFVMWYKVLTPFKSAGRPEVGGYIVIMPMFEFLKLLSVEVVSPFLYTRDPPFVCTSKFTLLLWS